jgi:cellobiose phosphorylase
MRAESRLGEDEIHLRAAKLAIELKAVSKKLKSRRSLTPRLGYCEDVLNHVQSRLSGAVRLEQGIALSAEWLLDNAHVIQGHIEDFRRNLPAKYYRELPFLVAGPWKGLPRVYAIACELVGDSDGALTRRGVESFLQTFQSETTLSTAELWALPMMLRLRLIEYLATFSLEIERRQCESERAAFWANRLLYTARREPGRIHEILMAVTSECPNPTPHIVEELLDNLYDEGTALTPVRAWLQTKFPSPLEDVVRQHEQLEVADQASLANSISTLRLLSQFDWREVFEAVSHVEAILWTDPALVYGNMEFETRDRYRRCIERLAKKRDLVEEVVAEAAIELAREGTEELTRHVGYFLVDHGLPALEARLQVSPTIHQRSRRFMAANPAFVYVTSIGITSALYVAAALWLSRLTGSSIEIWLLLSFLFLLPAADLAIQTVNYLFSRCVHPHSLPKMSFEHGIPDEFRTLVVVPMMLLTPESIKDEVERLEIRALANPDRNLSFALLSDYSDAPQPNMPEDLELLDVARRGIEALNESHGAQRFLLFYRERQWSDCEQCWMGWERKRGKLQDLNRFLMGDPGSDQELKLGAGSADAVSNIQFVLTLDSDTQLPRDTARRLVATLAHPLNCPHLSEDGRSVLRGYTIIQPRVSTSLPSATSSLFTRIFTDPTGMDPYTHAVSDLYQDLAGVGSYHGKGIYDLRAFHSVLTDRFPEGHLLSHDLIEGAYTRVGLASDVELLDLFPSNYGSYCDRQHRWIRGDWQIIDWLFRTVPIGGGGSEKNPLPALERWKIFDNLRRSLTPAAVLLMLIGGCAVSPNALICALLVVALLLASFIFPLATRITQRWLIDPIIWKEPAQNFLRSLLFSAALPHQAWLGVSAIVRVFYRRLITHRHLLEWATSSSTPRLKRGPRLLIRLAWSPVFAAIAVMIVMRFHPHEPEVIVPFALLWAASPFILVWLDRPLMLAPERALSPADKAGLRLTARQTWRYFDEFVGEKTNHLPPDNYQEMLRIEVAERTSPTNVGLYLISVLAAHDLGYVTLDQVVERVLATMRTIGKLELFRGHLLNWYNTTTLEPLGDRYVSMVDSGNLLGTLWCLERGLDELLDRPIFGHQFFQGLTDTLGVMVEYKPRAVASSETAALTKQIARRPEHLSDIAKQVRELKPLTAELIKSLRSGTGEGIDKCLYWATQLQSQVEVFSGILDRYFPWIEVLENTPESGILSLGPAAHASRRKALGASPSLRMLATGTVPGLLDLLALHGAASQLSPTVDEWLVSLRKKAEEARAAAKETHDLIDTTMKLVSDLDRNMDMRFLYEPERSLFAIGYNVGEQRLDRSYYDLLASEARLGSFLAVARGDVPTEHWWALGRPFGFAYFKRPMLSWSGTMFEYLMPLILTKCYANSLLDQACRTALECQMAYARRRGIPWGVSESAFSALDSRQIYQYHAFGIPELALKRSLEEAVVISPYSSALALAVNPRAAAKNLRKNGGLAKLGLQGDYGFYEAIDFSRKNEPQGERGLVIYTYMAHHQGMALLAIDNAVCGEIMQERFHSDPRVRATASLLYERVPVAPPLIKSYARENPIARFTPAPTSSGVGTVTTPDTPTPRTCLLSNGDYRAMVTNAGGGYSQWREFDITRWRSDTTADDTGKFCYLRDLDSGFVWSIAHHPTGVRSSTYNATFSAEKAEIRRRDRGIETIVEIVVSPEDDAEIWRLTIINRTNKTRRIELTSYSELALAPHGTDRTHPAFNKLFIETAMIRDLDALLAWRRLRSPEDKPIFAAQVIASHARSHEPTQFETDRARFIGRGRSVRNPIAADQPLQGTEGYVLDPIFSLRRTITIEPGDREEVAVVTVAASTREQALALASKYRDPESTSRAFNLAWTQAQLELRHLRIKPSDVQLYQQLASHVLYPHSHLRAPSDRLVKNQLGQRDLWAYGISGDLPIVVLTVSETDDMEVVAEVLAAHSFWRNRGLICDLVILNEEAMSYDQPLHLQIQRLISSRTIHTGIDKPGGVFLRPARQVPAEGVTLILAAARIVIVAARGPLSNQIGTPADLTPRVLSRPQRMSTLEEPSTALPYADLIEFNGYGGFTRDGREYVITLEAGRHTPRPWSNVLANANFGSLVSDEGSGFTWFGNSQSNRLTAWSNDPISNPAGEAIYIYDPDLNAIWTPNALPIRENDPYRTRHGQGYTVCEHNSHAIDQHLTTFVPVDDNGGLPVRVQTLKLTNCSSRRRTLTVTSYAEWTLGADRETCQQNVVTTWDLESHSIFARNSFSLSYSDTTAFAACSRVPESFTGDRTEVLGRNGSMANPSGLKGRGLSGRCGGGLDPCAGLQIQVTLEPNETTEISFFIGATRSHTEARDLIRQLRRPGAIADALQATRDFWDGVLGTIAVKTPDETANLMLNRWLLYQTIACRFWGRSGFYQSGGAFGFRDQLQDVMALLYAKPDIARAHIVRCAGRQFLEGDVQHWWHPEAGAGVRTRISDDLLFLPYVVSQYVRVTGDLSILEVTVPFLEGKTLAEGEHDAYFAPGESKESGTIWEHCRRAIERGSTVGVHGLPLIGGGDWNDGLDRVGAGGKGESVWLAWFLAQVLKEFAGLTDVRDAAAADQYRKRAEVLVASIDAQSWDGEWYRRAYFDDGSPLGSKESQEAKIDSLSQSWAAITGGGSLGRAEQAMRSVNEYLVKEDEKLVLLFEPPFDSSPQQPGYIKGYPPGVRENGGQYTHGALWAAMGWARLGNGTQATRLLNLMNPIQLSTDPEKYLVEPYVVAADVYNLPDRVGMGGWTWYTGSAAWMYRIWLEEILGLKVNGHEMKIEPVIPPGWSGFTLRYRFVGTWYFIEVQNPEGVESGVVSVTLDDSVQTRGVVPLVDDGEEHHVVVVLGVRVNVPAR